MRKIILTTILITALGCLRAAPLPEGWRAPTVKEVDQDWRKDGPHRYMTVKADFNGDGIEDEAKLLIKQNGKGMALFALVSKGQQYESYMLHEDDDAGWLEVMGINVAEKGKYRTACGKGYFECEPGESEEIVLKYPGIDYFKEGSANSFYYWDDKINKFKRTWISD